MDDKVKVSLADTQNRKEGVKAAIRALGINPAKGRNVLVKPNFNTADPTPGSTHNDALASLIDELWSMGAKTISLGERSFPLTERVIKQKGILPVLEELDVRVIDFDRLEKEDWVEFKPKGSHWENGFRIARPILEAECLVSTGCIKTHQFGGIFTMSLKLHVGVVPTVRHGFTYMNELHTSPYQRFMIAEINEPFRPHLVVLDGVDVFVDGGPATGKPAQGNVFLASADRVAADAAGIAVLKSLGSNADIMGRKIFAQEQIARAVELNLGVQSAAGIELIAADAGSGNKVETISGILRAD